MNDEQKDRPDREKIAGILKPYCAARYDDKCLSDGVNMCCNDCNKK